MSHVERFSPVETLENDLIMKYEMPSADSKPSENMEAALYDWHKRRCERTFLGFEGAVVLNAVASMDAANFSDGTNSMMGVYSRYHQAILSPIILRVQAKNMTHSNIRWMARVTALLEIIIYITVTHDMMYWMAENFTAYGRIDEGSFFIVRCTVDAIKPELRKYILCVF